MHLRRYNEVAVIGDAPTVGVVPLRHRLRLCFGGDGDDADHNAEERADEECHEEHGTYEAEWCSRHRRGGRYWYNFLRYKAVASFITFLSVRREE